MTPLLSVCWTLCADASYEQFMVQMEVIKSLSAHPTRFICSEGFIVVVFHKMKLNVLHYCSHVWPLYVLTISFLII